MTYHGDSATHKFKCGVCGRTFSEEEIRIMKRIMCPYCGSKIIYKMARKFRIVKAI